MSKTNKLAVEQTRQGELSPTETAIYEAASLFIQTEKDIVQVGFFTPTRKGLKETREKVVRLMSPGSTGQAVERSIKIVTGGNYGLPGTGDLDKWLAFQKLVTDIKRERGFVSNPISFTTAELLILLGVHKDSGKNYKMVEEWLDRMCATSIESEGSGIFSGKRKFAKQRGLRVFDRAVSVGRELDGGEIAAKNFVWLSPWQLENINNNVVIPVDFALYLSLENPIAKTLLPLLQIWFYATRDARVFEKRYEDLCQLLGTRQYPRKGLIEQTLGPSLDELRGRGLIGAWSVERAASRGGFKILLRHGTKFIERRGPRALLSGGINEDWLAELTSRGVEETVARDLLREITDNRPLLDQLDYIDSLIRRARGRITNPPGFIVSRVRKNIPIPADFGTRAEREAAERERQEEEERTTRAIVEQSRAWDEEAERKKEERARQARHERLRRDYESYRRGEIEKHVESLGGDEYKRLWETAREKVLEEQPELKVLKDHILESFIVEKIIELAMPQVALLSFEEFSGGQE